MKDIGEFKHRIQAAGAVTMIFGLLIAVLPAAYVILRIFLANSGDATPIAELSLTLLFGVGFVLLGWGILRHSRLCAALAGALSATLLTLQLVTTLMTTRRPSAFFLVLSAFVLIANWVAWRQMGHQPNNLPTQDP